MSWHTSGLFIRGDERASPGSLFRLLGLPPCDEGEAVDFDTATSLDAPGRCWAFVGGWHVIFDPMMFADCMGDPSDRGDGIWPQSLERAFAANRWDVVSFLVEGSSGTYGFAQYEQGRRWRCFLAQEDSIVLDQGQPGPEERSAFGEFPGDFEQGILALVQKLTVPWDELMQASYQTFAIG